LRSGVTYQIHAPFADSALYGDPSFVERNSRTLKAESPEVPLFHETLQAAERLLAIHAN
jgi:hypothetical protein